MCLLLNFEKFVKNLSDNSMYHLNYNITILKNLINFIKDIN